ncbi:MAG: ribosomal protein S18-alanine N-acetyltransferase [Rhodobacteraceae bacterium]|nr:ribosomal protein S18-alanine N-acetyltransferase [Paracoccaceae bacterium]
MTPETLAHLHAACFTTPRPWSQAEFDSLLDARGVFLLTEPGGFLMGRVIADEAELLTLAVDPNRRRTGIARALVGAFHEEVKTRKAQTAFLEVAEDNTAARALYLATGWIESGRRKAYYHAPDGTPHDAIIMVLPIDGAQD